MEVTSLDDDQALRASVGRASLSTDTAVEGDTFRDLSVRESA